MKIYGSNINVFREMDISDKVILVDCDGVLLDWEYSFYQFMINRGYEVKEPGHYKINESFGIPYAEGKSLVIQFNESAQIGFLHSLRDAVKYVRKLHEEHGYVFHCITSLSTDPYAKKLRVRNLEKLFGKNIFEEVVCLPCGADKDDALEPYRNTGCIWVEDKPVNAELGYELGLRPFLIEHPHNKDYQTDNFPKVKNWKELYDYIV